MNMIMIVSFSDGHFYCLFPKALLSVIFDLAQFHDMKVISLIWLNLSSDLLIHVTLFFIN